MIFTKNSKYEYWKWLLLKKHTKKYEPNLIAVYNPIKNIIFRLDLKTGEKVGTFWLATDYLFEHCLAEYLEIGELEEFYKSLPTDKKEKFWECLSISLAVEGEK